MKNASNPQVTDPAALKQLFAHHLNRLYFGKHYLNDTLERLVNIASFRNLKLALEELWDDVKKQLDRLDEIYEKAGIKPSDADCIPVQSIFKEVFTLERRGIGMELLSDMDLMLYMQLIEHINITAYRMLRILAGSLNYAEIDQLLIESFDESVDDDRLFLMITNEYLAQQDA